MARTEARIHTSIWRDPDWRERSVHAQWLYELLLSQPTVSFCGVLGLMPTRWAKMAKGMTPAKVLSHLKELEDARYVIVDYDTEEVWIRSFVKWDGVLDQPALTTSMMKDFAAIQSEPIRDGLLDGLGDGFLDGLPERFPKWFGGDKERVIPDEFLEGSRGRATRAHASPRLPLSPSPIPLPAPVVSAPSAAPPADKPPAKRATATPDSFELDDDLRSWAGENVPTICDEMRLFRETAKFLDHHRAKGSTMKDWRAAWRNWMLRAVEYAPAPANGVSVRRVSASDDAITRVFAQLPRGEG